MSGHQPEPGGMSPAGDPLARDPHAASSADDLPARDAAAAASSAADPLARIGSRLIGAAQARRRRRRHHLQQTAGAALTLILLAAAVVALTPFDVGGTRPAPGGQRVSLDAAGGRFAVYATDRAAICANRPNGRDPAGTTICAFQGLVLAQLRQPARSAWVQARAEGDRVVVTGLAAPDAQIVVGTPPLGANRGGKAESVPGGPTVTVRRVNGPTLVARPFSLTIARNRAKRVQLVTRTDGRIDTIETVPIDAPAPSSPSGFRRLTYSVDDAASVAERAQARLQAIGPERSQVIGDGNRLTATVSPQDSAFATAALGPGNLTVYDWEASALLPDGTTVAQGLADGVARATAISRRGAASVGMTLADARTQLRALDGHGRIVQSFGLDRGRAMPRSDPRARFFVLRGQPALRGAERATTQIPPGGGEVTFELVFADAQRAAWHDLTRAVSQRGQGRMLPGVAVEDAAQHVALVLDDRLIELYPVDPQRQPDGVPGNALPFVGRSGRIGVALVQDMLAIGPLPRLAGIGGTPTP
ncbi:hypothetical protein [Conexibacter sp. CPCC 206217]|uniref:hypothetical protein n=1 Tax=Conexibacter sp. CPCC 206217 TaxID=3064574 RepID=UPI00271D2500|nr:hypothetical protein [Conexibacter sp. CPCC 206217]MDO8211216.1 hypothetical protein [Conexibacter sp. CPCC 206217]